jgi:hypothetical protein
MRPGQVRGQTAALTSGAAEQRWRARDRRVLEITVFNVGTTGPGDRYDPAVTSWLVQFGQRTALMGISV